MISEEQKDILNSIFQSQNLPQEDRDFWFEQLSILGEKSRQIQDILIKWMENNAGDIPWLTEIQRKKIEVMESRNQKDWETLLEEEENYLRNNLPDSED